jgi:hypothetical protein
MKRVKKGIHQNKKLGISLRIRARHTVRLKVTDEPFTVHTGFPFSPPLPKHWRPIGPR